MRGALDQRRTALKQGSAFHGETPETEVEGKTPEQPLWHHNLLVLMYPQHQGLISSPASPQDFGSASSALHLLQTGDWNVLRHDAEEGTEVSAAPEAAQF